jgi:parallel beta-helix repeat protein
MISGGSANDSVIYEGDSIVFDNKAGTAGNEIVITCSDETGHNGKPILRNGLVVWYSSHYVTVDGKNRLEINQNYEHGIYLYSSKHVTLKRIRIKGINTNIGVLHGIRIANYSDSCVIDSCNIRWCTGDGINASLGPETALSYDNYSNLVVTNCDVDSCSDDGIQLAVANATVANNYFRFIPPSRNGSPAFGGHPDGIQVSVDNYSYKIIGNVFSSYTQGIFLEKTKGYGVVANNIVYDDSACLPIPVDGTTNRSISLNKSETGVLGPLIVSNNVFYNAYWYAVTFFDPYYSGNELIFTNNIILNARRWFLFESTEAEDAIMPLIGKDNILYITNDAMWDNEAYPDSGTHADPLVVDHNNFVFTITNQNSPAIGNGVNLSQYFTTDKNNISRPTSGAWDIGAYIVRIIQRYRRVLCH